MNHRDIDFKKYAFVVSWFANARYRNKKNIHEICSIAVKSRLKLLLNSR